MRFCINTRLPAKYRAKQRISAASDRYFTVLLVEEKRNVKQRNLSLDRQSEGSLSRRDDPRTQTSYADHDHIFYNRDGFLTH